VIYTQQKITSTICFMLIIINTIKKYSEGAYKIKSIYLILSLLNSMNLSRAISYFVLLSM